MMLSSCAERLDLCFVLNLVKYVVSCRFFTDSIRLQKLLSIFSFLRVFTGTNASIDMIVCVAFLMFFFFFLLK